MIADAINSALAEVWANIWAKIGPYVTLSFLDPFWGWLLWGVVAALIVSAVVRFFGGWMPTLRPIGGVIIIIIAACLATYRKAQKETRAHDKKWKRK